MGTSSPEAIAAAKRDTEIIEMKRAGLTFEEIGAHFAVTRQVVHRCFHRGLRRVPVKAVEEYRAEQLARIETQREIALDVMHAEHPLVSNGKRFDDLSDDGPVLAAIDRMIKLDAQESDLLGLKAPVKVESEVSVLRYEVVGTDVGGVV